MHSDDDLPLVVFGQYSDETSELGNVDLVHRLNGVVEDQTRNGWFDREMQCEEQGQCRSVQIPGAQHHLGRSADFPGYVGCLECELKRGSGRIRVTERRDVLLT